MSELRIPFAIDGEGKLQSPETAKKGNHYVCPACGAPIVFRQGRIKAAHFAHKASDTCSQESITHKTAKLLVQRAVEEWKIGRGQAPTLRRTCQICGMTADQCLPEKVNGAVLEHRLADGSIVDVALLVGEIAQAAVEIRVTHAVDVAKANRLPVPFIELGGDEVITTPSVWRPITDHFNPLICGKCRSTRAKFQQKTEKIARENDLDLPDVYYRHGFCGCWKCGRDIIVFAWPRDRIHDDSAPTITPPRTVQRRFSKTVGHQYWANTCPYCQSIQGDFFLYSEPDGPFWGITITEDSLAAFDKDMMKIAAHAAYMGWL